MNPRIFEKNSQKSAPEFFQTKDLKIPPSKNFYAPETHTHTITNEPNFKIFISRSTKNPPVEIRFPLFKNSFHKKLKKKHFEKLIVNETPSLSKAYDLLKTPWFREKIADNSKIFSVEFKIDKVLFKINENFYFDPDIFTERSFLIIFKSTVGKRTKFFWKVAGDNSFLKFELYDKVLSRYFRNFITQEVKNSRNGK